MIVEAGELIPVIKAMCSSTSGYEIQDYIRENHDGITIIVYYLLVLSRYFSAAVAGFALQGKQHQDTRKFSKLVVQQIGGTLETIANLVKGPNPLNIEYAVGGSLLEVASKFLVALDLNALFEKDAQPTAYYGKLLTPIEAFYESPMFCTLLQLVVTVSFISCTV